MYNDNFERRSNIRFHINCSVRHKYRNENEWQFAFSDNIAYSGILLVSKRKYQEKENVEIKIDFPGMTAPIISFTATVVWILKVKSYNDISYLTGLEFDSFSPEQDFFISSLLKKCTEVLKN